jgi:hypothetical protein
LFKLLYLELKVLIFLYFSLLIYARLLKLGFKKIVSLFLSLLLLLLLSLLPSLKFIVKATRISFCFLSSLFIFKLISLNFNYIKA